MPKYPFITLPEVELWRPEARRLGVSEVSRSERGFTTAYYRANGKPINLPEKWYHIRDAFIARHLVQYQKKPTYRRGLALMMWAYRPPEFYKLFDAKQV